MPSPPPFTKAPIYLLLGPEKVQKRERVAAILQQHGIANDPANPARSQYFAGDSSVEEIMSEITTYPFFGGKKAVIIHEAEHLPRPALEAYFAAPLDTTVLLLLSEKSKGKFSVPLERLCEKFNGVEMFWELFENKLIPWADAQARRVYGLAPPPGLGALLADICGSASLAEQSLQILANRFGHAPFTLDEAGAVLGTQRGSTVFECVEHCFGGKAALALLNLRALLAEGENPILVQAMLMRQAELLWRYQAGARTKESLKLQHAGAFREIENQSRFWSLPLLSRALRLISGLDHSLKSEPGYVSALRLELAILALARRKFV
jgi:DNA polymerase III delta subunit